MSDAIDGLRARLLLPEFAAERSRITTIGKVKNPGGILGNMSPHSVEFELDGVRVVWPRAEQLFQAMRFPADHMIREFMSCEVNPMRAKMAAKAYLDDAIVQPRSEQDLANMRLVCAAKLAQHRDVTQELLRSHQLIVEDCSGRASESGTFWGACEFKIGQWRGRNELGKIWMVLREEMR